MKLEKYHGLGNTFLITKYEANRDYSSLAKKLCDSNVSVGSDGLIIVKENPIEMLIYNKDGSEAIMCGNGLRCLIHYCFNNNLLNNRNTNIEVRTKSGMFYVDIIDDEEFVTRTIFRRSLVRKEIIRLFDEIYDSYYVQVGVKHNVIIVNKDNKLQIDKLKNDLLKNEGFCVETNIDIVEIESKNVIRVLTYERGVGFTSSCGTGSIASCLVANYLYSCSNKINVVNKYGVLEVEIQGNKVFAKGPSAKVCDIEVIYA